MGQSTPHPARTAPQRQTFDGLVAVAAVVPVGVALLAAPGFVLAFVGGVLAGLAVTGVRSAPPPGL